VLFRIGKILKSSGAELAFPSQTLYIGRDARPEQNRSEMARKEVGEWRKNHQFPFPYFPSSKLNEIDNTLKYPPPGSPDFCATEEEFSKGGERLSAEEQGGNGEPSEAKSSGKNYTGKSDQYRPRPAAN
jgi:MscS family membrane protein